ncbi:hypothetical protein D3C71_1507810 [compost metagenome]
MEPDLLLQLAIAEPCGQRRQQRLQKLLILLRVGVSVPTEQRAKCAVDLHQNFWRMRRPPLGEQRGNLKMFNPLFLRHIHPLGQPLEIKPITLRGTLYANQLYRGALAADGGIQRWREDRRQQHVDSTVDRTANKVAYRQPVFGTEHRHAVIIRQTIGMHPFGVQQGLRRQFDRDNMQRQGGAGQGFAADNIKQGQVERVIPAWHRRRRRCISQPKAVVIIVGDKETPLGQRHQRIGK